ncbi:MAG: bifunctional diguanylate cyclase/phosphodiesterase [Pseudomonadota bacterium]
MTGQSNQTIAALLRFIASRLDVKAIGAFRIAGTSATFWDGTDAFHYQWARRTGAAARLGSRTGSAAGAALVPHPDAFAGDLQTLPDQIEAAITDGRAQRLDPKCLGIAAPFAAVMPVCVDGGVRAFLLVLSNRRRWLGTGAASALRDAADILADLIAKEEAAGPPQHGAMPVMGGTGDAFADSGPLSHPEALRMIREMPSSRALGGKAVLMLDIDRFRALNEALGATAGDYILSCLYERLSGAVGPEDRLARLGGDRFLVLTRRTGTELTQFADHLLARVAASLQVGGKPVVMQATIGLVDVAAERNPPAATLFMQADKALRRGKTEGGARICLHDPSHDATQQEQSRLEVDLGAAIRAEQLRLAYQPYVSLLDGSIAGVEALLRWQHPGRGELTPSSFMTLAETSGQILPIGSWVFREALCRASEWPDRVTLSVNVSALQFQQADFTTQIDTALALSGFPAERLEIEITETVLMRDDPETLGLLRTLIARGIRIALDDFGTGYSALSYLARLPHHRIKIDKKFIDDLENPSTNKVIRAIVSSARAQGISVTAEGIETQPRLDMVRKMGFTHAQGFLMSLPVEDPNTFLDPESQRASA